MTILKEKFKQINLFALLALFVVGGLALELKAEATDEHQSTTTFRPIYDQDGEILEWENVDHLNSPTDYQCEAAETICTAEFPEGVTPTPDMTPVSEKSGHFSPIQ